MSYAFRKLFRKLNLRRHTTAIFYYMGLAMAVLLFTVIAIAVKDAREVGFSWESLDAKLNSTLDDFKLVPVGIIAATVLYTAIRYLAVRKSKKRADDHIQSRIDVLSTANPLDRDELERLNKERQRISHAAHEGNKTAVEIYGSFEGEYGMDVIYETMHASSINRIEDFSPESVEPRLAAIKMLSKHRKYEQAGGDWQEIYCSVVNDPECVYEIEPIVARGVTDMKTIQQLRKEIKDNLVAPVSEGWL